MERFICIIAMHREFMDLSEGVIYLAFGAVLAISVLLQVRRHLKKEAGARKAADRHGQTGKGPQAQHPHIDITHCIGCGACVSACPEGQVLGLVGGKAALVDGEKCIGHGLCADVCPVGAIEIVMAPPTMTADLPVMTSERETNLPNLFVAGELSGLALIKNAVAQGQECIDVIARRLPSLRRRLGRIGQAVDVVIVGAGPAGLSASLRAKELKLSSVTLEAEEFGGTVSKYPRQKLVMTSPMTLPILGQLRKLQFEKEDLLALWQKAAARAGLEVRTHERVEHLALGDDGLYLVQTPKDSYRALSVVLAIGRRGSPRKLGVPGEELPKVMYTLVDAEAYSGKQILVVGGGDSAVEAALGLAYQKGNKVTLSYRKDSFTRLKDRNARLIRDAMRRNRVKVRFNSQPVEIRERSVLLQIPGGRVEEPNDYVWVFAGGLPPNTFLESIGVRLGLHEMSEQVREEMKGVA